MANPLLKEKLKIGENGMALVKKYKYLGKRSIANNNQKTDLSERITPAKRYNPG